MAPYANSYVRSEGERVGNGDPTRGVELCKVGVSCADQTVTIRTTEVGRR